MFRTVNSIAQVVVLVTAVCVMSPVRAEAQGGDWVSHVDPSMISEIVLRNGELFIATGGGLLVYDPSDSTFDHFTNTIGLPSNVLTCLTFDSKGTLYAGTLESGIARLDLAAGGFEVSTLSATFHGLTDDRITSLTAWGDSLAYGTKLGAGLIVKGFPGSRFLTEDGLPSETIADVFADGEVLWLATDNGVARLDRFGFITEFSNGLPSLDAHVFARDDTSLWVGTADGVAQFDPSDSTWSAAGLSGEAVFAIRYDGQRVWASSRRTLFENSGSGWVNHSFINIFQKYLLNAALGEARGLQPMPDGSVYLGVAQTSKLRGAFLLVFDGSVVRDLPVDAPPMNSLLRATFDIDGSLWVASQSYGVGKLTPNGKWFNYTPASGDTNLSSIFTNLTLLADSKGSKWFGTLWRPALPVPLDELQDRLDLSYDNDTWIHHTIGSGGGDGLGSLRNQRAKEDPSGNRWFLSDIEEGTSPSGWLGINILSEDKTEWKQITPATTSGGMPTGNITDVFFAPGGVVYVADKAYGVLEWATGGLDMASLFDLTDDTWATRGTVVDDFNAGDVTSVVWRSDGVLWVGTTEGVYKGEGGSFKHIRADRGFEVGLLSGNVLDLLLDRRENLWVATDLGINRIARDDDGDIRSFTTPSVWQTQLSLFFPPNVVSPLVNAFCEDLALHPARDLLYIATRGGLSVLNLSAFEPGATNLSDVYVFPNPIRPRRGHTALKIANHNSTVDVEIYTLEGELVHSSQNIGESDDIVWDLTTDSRFLAASGVYVVRVRRGSETIVRMVSLIR